MEKCQNGHGHLWTFMDIYRHLWTFMDMSPPPLAVNVDISKNKNTLFSVSWEENNDIICNIV